MEQTGRSTEIQIGLLKLGGEQAVRLQSMTNTDTNDVEASVAQCIRMIDAGADLVRLTTQGSREVKSLGRVKEELRRRGYDTPLVADIHFKASLAFDAAKVVEKIRINPGNYLKGGGPGDLLPELLKVCREHGTAIRIGVNHGSLGSTILERFGDTPEGMAESAMEFLRICHNENFKKVVVSLKSSNPRVMIQAVRLLKHKMNLEGMSYPFHLGVTEAGDGDQARIKSACGMAPLLMEGLGETIRVSLSEDPEAELPVAAAIAELFPKPATLPYDPLALTAWDPFSFKRRMARSCCGIGGATRVKVVSPEPPDPKLDSSPADLEKPLKEKKLFILEGRGESLQEVKNRLHGFCLKDKSTPIIFKTSLEEKDDELFRLKLSGQLGFLLVDGLLDGVWVESPGRSTEEINDTVLGILQAAGARISKTEYIACPSCGRTHFNLVSRLKEIRAATSHLKTLKIGVMGCIVNGPGEMADADYGYVGAGPGKVSIYKGHEPRIKNLPEEDALEALIRLIKEEGDWVDPVK